MRDTTCGEDSLPMLALLYACDELDAADAADFERRLADDQSAREALVQAVELNRTLSGLAALAPNPGYRSRVSARLGQVPLWRRLAAPRGYQGHPALWAFAGAAAAILVMMSLPAWSVRPTAVEMKDLAVMPATPNPMPPAEAEADEIDTEVAVVWSEVPRGGHLTRAIGDGNRRRTRLEDRRPVRSDQRLSRFLTPTRMMN